VVRQALPDALLRRALMGLAMGATADALIYSPWGKRSGAHINPAVTLTFHVLGKIPAADALGYAIAQFAGGAVGVWVMHVLWGTWLADPNVHWVATVPGPWGWAPAFVAELAISGVLMFAVLAFSGHPRLAMKTGWIAGALVATWILLEAPISGMSMNPARTFGSAVIANDWRAWWLYFVAPPLGMGLAAITYTLSLGRVQSGCAKLVHAPEVPCIFCEARAARAR
jgi:aquaporin Z